MSNKRIYLDNAAATQIDHRVFKEVNFHLKNTFGNAGSLHEEGIKAKKVLDSSRIKVAGFFSAHPDEIVFTSGGTESNNLAITGLIARIENLESGIKNKNKLHAITTKIEHSSVLECFKKLEQSGLYVTYLPVNSKGVVELSDLKKALRPETVLVSIQYANNEIGTIQPIREIAKIIRHHNSNKGGSVIFHTDASQAPCYLDCNVEKLGVDLLTLDGHKIYGPKGVGALYIRRGIVIEPAILGGGQEDGLRSGTENVPLIGGLARALEICGAERDIESRRLLKIRDEIHSKIIKNLRMDSKAGAIVLNGDLEKRLPNNINISISNLDTTFLTLQLDAAGISVSTKSTCNEGEEGSYVVSSLGGERWRSEKTLRVTLGRFTKKSDIKIFLKFLSGFLKK